MNFQNDILEDLICGKESELEKFNDVEVGYSGKFYDIHELVFKFNFKFYRIKYVICFTESPEDEEIVFVDKTIEKYIYGFNSHIRDIKGDNYEVECEEVTPFIKTVIDYKPA